tara:strand:- start:446 stop:1603 length:1158 start_codon:yes stop_codon:yes gene_type:complete
VIDIGPGAGEKGGKIISAGTPKDILRDKSSLTGNYLSGIKVINYPNKRRQKDNKKILTIYGAEQNNLKCIDVEIPLGIFTCITGVSGSGKSSLISDTIYPILAKKIYKSNLIPGIYKSIVGDHYIDKVIQINQSPIGRTPRSNPSTYTGSFTPIREWYSELPLAKSRGYKPGRFSFNVKGGRCEPCQGDGVIKIEMHFLPDVYVTCDICNGKRYNRETLEIKYKKKSISDILNMTVQAAITFFSAIPSIKEKLLMLDRVGLGYIKVGQSANTLSGGESQRVKLAKELSKRPTGKTLYILDEPTTGLHFEDVKKLLEILQQLVTHGNTVIVIEHNLDVIKNSDWIIDLGPEGGSKGGAIIAQGSPETIIENKNSYTGKYLKKLLNI